MFSTGVGPELRRETGNDATMVEIGEIGFSPPIQFGLNKARHFNADNFGLSLCRSIIVLWKC